MHVLKKILAAFCFTLLAVPAWAQSAAEAVDEGTVTFVEAFNSGDGARLAALYTEDAALLPPGADRVEGREAIAAFWQGAMDSGLVLNRIEVIEVIESGDHAIDTGAIYLNVPDGSGGFTEVGMKYVVGLAQG
jgi:uncharacterized protein (TIGR02246 family)